MTTTVTVKTHAHPAAVGVEGSTYSENDQRRAHHSYSTTDFVPPNSARDFTLSCSLNITVTELPAEATGLSYGVKDCPDTSAGMTTLG